MLTGRDLQYYIRPRVPNRWDPALYCRHLPVDDNCLDNHPGHQLGSSWSCKYEMVGLGNKFAARFKEQTD